MTNMEFNEKIVDINQECTLRKFEDAKKAEREVNAYLIEKQKEVVIEEINRIYNIYNNSSAPIISDNGKYVTLCSGNGVTPFDLKK